MEDDTLPQVAIEQENPSISAFTHEIDLSERLVPELQIMKVLEVDIDRLKKFSETGDFEHIGEGKDGTVFRIGGKAIKFYWRAGSSA